MTDIEELKRLAKAGDIEAMEEVAWAYDHGDGKELEGHSPTCQQSCLKATTALVEFVGVLDEQLGVSRKFGIIVDQISESLSNLSK